jgi:hypothetical protein
MKRLILPLAALVYVLCGAVAGAQQKPEYYFLAFNGSSQDLRLEIRAGAFHTLALNAAGNGQVIFRSSGSYADVSFMCSGSRRNVGVHLNVKDPQIHFTIAHDCRVSVRYLPEPKG